MRRLNITPAEMESVCGRMVACRAAEHLGLNINQFYYIAKKLSLKRHSLSQDGATTKTKECRRLSHQAIHKEM